MTKEEIIEKKKEYLSDKEERRLQKQLINIYKKEYEPKHNAKVYLKLILDWNVGEISERKFRIDYYPEMVFECFSCVSQRVYGYTKEHCLDQIYEAVQRKKQRIKDYKKLPTLQELVESRVEIDPEKTYNTKEKGTYEDSCDGYGGRDILEMREIGIEEYKIRSFKKFIEWAHE